MPRLRVHNVAIQTADFDKSFDFYANILGLPVVREPYEYKKQRTLAWLDGGSILIELYTVKHHLEPTAHDPNRVGPDHLAFEVADFDQAVGCLEQRGWLPIKPPFIPPSGDPAQRRVVFFNGPDGEELQLREPPRS